ncbi:MAG TPA: GGDEF domain-containing protein [Solirubrobacterales bacterium]|nr:GGDEF domain-containing protein [Solirubrobacterales bacterium]
MREERSDTHGPLVESSWLIRDGMDRERMIDMDRRLQPVRRKAFGVLALALLASGPWVGWWTLAPLAVAGVFFAVADRTTIDMKKPEYVMFAAWAAAEVIIAASVALTGAAQVATLSWLAIPIVTLASRFSKRGIVAGVAIALFLLVLVAFAVDTRAVLDNPPLVIAPAALILTVTMFSTALMRSDIEFRSRAVIDPLTGMLNRAALLTRAEELAQQSTVTGDPVGIVVVDVDNFKAINDTWGHATGDAVLRDLAQRLRRELRSFDLAYRLGGEEFLVLLPGADARRAGEVAQQLCAAVGAEPCAGVEVTVSCGVSASAPASAFDYDAIFLAADEALFEAKRAGRNCVKVGGETAAGELPADALSG